MTVHVLKKEAENNKARIELRSRGLDCTDPWLVRNLRRAKILNGINIGDPCKSWDVLKSLQFIENNVPSDGPILDIGAYASEMLCALQRMKYTHLTGVDVNPNITNMPHTDKIRYLVSDFMHTPFVDASFSAITAISVIEHGFNSRALLAELSRLLRPGGYFIASVDYWPEKIDTSRIKAFGMDWQIFSQADLIALFEEARSFGLTPAGDSEFEAANAVIKWQGKQYTFAWLVLKKTA